MTCGREVLASRRLTEALGGGRRDGQLVKNVESLSATTAQAAKDIHRLSQDVMTKENVDALRESVMTMTKVGNGVMVTVTKASNGM